MVRVGTSVAVLLLGAGMALGQNALGDGRALDRNGRIGGTGANEQTRDYLAEFRFRNALVTGNVPGGAGFRGITGYDMDYEFRQRVGSDDLFSFRRDSFTSGLAGTGIRGTEALQYQFALTVGNAPPRNLRGSLLTSRTGERVTGALPSQPLTPTGGTVDIRQATAEEAGQYELGTLLSLRSISAYTAGRSLGPAMLQMGEDPQGLTQGMIASPLRGLARESLLGDSEQPGPAQSDPAGAAEDDGEPSPGQDERFGRFPSGRLGAERDVLERLSKDFDARTGAPRLPGEQIEDDSTGQPDAGVESPPGGAPMIPGAGEMNPVDPFSTRISELQQVLRDGLAMDRGAGAVGPSGEILTPSQRVMEERIEGWQDLVTTLKTGTGTITVPASAADRASAYDLHVDRAQRMMEQGRYFEAEQRFTMALAARPGDAIAAIGRVHAQIGAGLDLSAAVNLRAFLVERPEFVAARYETGMLPAAERLTAASDRLQAQLDDENARSRLRESALLLAYVSFHRDDAEVVQTALERLSKGRNGQRDVLVALLQAVWLDKEEHVSPADDSAEGDGDQ